MLLALALLLALFAPTPAHAADDQATVAKLRELYDRGTEHYNLMEYKQALESFKSAYHLRHDPTFLFNIAQCHRQLGAFSEAAGFYRAFLRESSDLKNREQVEKLIAEMDRAAEDQRARQHLEPSGTSAPKATDTHATTPTTTNRPELTASAPTRQRPLVKRPWFWATVVGGAAVVAAGVALGVVYGSQSKDPVATVGRVSGN
jgi:tetratricopeptide (TPR) repeat protein